MDIQNGMEGVYFIYIYIYTMKHQYQGYDMDSISHMVLTHGFKNQTKQEPENEVVSYFGLIGDRSMIRLIMS